MIFCNRARGIVKNGYFRSKAKTSPEKYSNQILKDLLYAF